VTLTAQLPAAARVQEAVIETARAYAVGGDLTLGIAARGSHIGPVGVLIVTGGPQYRIGSHRQFVLLSRALAAAGVACFRFDLRGMGDGEGSKAEFTAIDDEIAAASATFAAEVPQLEAVVLLGLCDGASAALLDACSDDAARGLPVRGIVAINPWIRTEQSRAAVEVRHHYGSRLVSAQFWRRLLTGQVDLADAAAGFLRSLGRSVQKPGEAVAAYPERMAAGARALDSRVLWILSGQDLTAREFEQYAANSPAWQGLLGSKHAVLRLADADHTFSRLAWREQVVDAVIAWMAQR